MVDQEEATSAGKNESAERLTVSIALATYNGERFLSEQLESLARQTVLPNELVVSDDGSTDGTLKILESFARSAPFDVRISSNSETLGYRKNFLKAAEACKSDVIFFCDQDDIWDDLKISVMRDAFLNPDTIMAYHHAELIDQAGKPIGRFYQEFPHTPWRFVLGMSIAFRRCLLIRPDLVSFSIDYHAPESNMAHDQWVSLLAWAFGPATVVDRTLIRYRQHRGSVYGVLPRTPRVNILERVSKRVKDRADAFELLAESCRTNKVIFGELSREQDLTAAWRKKAQFAENKFEELGIFFVHRVEIHTAPSLAKRFVSFCKLLRLGAYSRTRDLTFGLRGAVRDVLLGVLFGPLITEFGSPKVFEDLNCRRLF